MRVKSSLKQTKTSYEIYYEVNFDKLYEILKKEKANYQKIMVVSDNKVAANYLKEMKDNLLKIGAKKVASFVVDHGEKQKNESNYLDLIKKLKEEDFEQKDLIIALGGCAVNAICNFASGTYLGGIDYVHIPTTLSAMINGTVANVCAINLMTYQNTLCSYATPLFVYDNVEVLKTLHLTQYNKGIVHGIKLALTQDESYFNMIYENRQKLLDRDNHTLIEIIKKGNEIRNDVKKKKDTLTLIDSEGFGMAFYNAFKECKGFGVNDAQLLVYGIVKAVDLSSDLLTTDSQKITSLFEFFGFKTRMSIKEKEQPKIMNSVLKYRGKGKEDDLAQVNMILLSDIGFCYKKNFKTQSLMPEVEHKPKIYKGNSVLKFALFFFLSSILVFLDQWTKYAVSHFIDRTTILSFCGDLVEIFYYQNEGAAFGILQGKQHLFFFLTLIVIVLIIYFLYRMPFLKKYKTLFIFAILLFSGALGNFIDRVRMGYVVDFIYFKPINFPVFNLADCFITFSCFLILYSIVFIYQEKDFEFLTNK